LTLDKGILVKSGDEISTVNELNKMLNNLEQYNQQNLHNYAVDNFSYKAVGKSFSKIFNQIVVHKKQ